MAPTTGSGDVARLGGWGVENCCTRWGAAGKGPLFLPGREESRRPEGEVGTSTLSDQLESGCLFFCKNPAFGRGPGGLEGSGRCLILGGLKGKCRQTWGRPDDWAASLERRRQALGRGHGNRRTSPRVALPGKELPQPEAAAPLCAPGARCTEGTGRGLASPVTQGMAEMASDRLRDGREAGRDGGARTESVSVAGV